jgi:hypothetical protein
VKCEFELNEVCLNEFVHTTRRARDISKSHSEVNKSNRKGHRKLTFGSKQTIKDFAKLHSEASKRDISQLRSEVSKPRGNSHNYARKWANCKGSRLITLGNEKTAQDILQITFESEQNVKDISQLRSKVSKLSKTSPNYAWKWRNRKAHLTITLESEQTLRDIA